MTRLLHTSVLFRAITALVVCHGHVPKTNKFDYVFGKAPEKPRVPSMVQLNTTSTCAEIAIGHELSFGNTSLTSFAAVRARRATFPHLIDITPSIPQTRRIYPTSEMLCDESLEHYCIQLTFTDPKGCLTVSLQDPEGKIFNETDNIRNASYYQSLMTAGKICVQRDLFPNGFLLVIVMHEDATVCRASGNPTQISLINPTFTLVTGSTLETKGFDATKVVAFLLTTPPFKYGATYSILRKLAVPLYYIAAFYMSSLYYFNSIQKPGLENRNKPELGKELKKTGKIQINNIQQAQSKRFYNHAMLLVVAFYIIPVVKQGITFYRLFHATGNQDMCFSDFTCSIPYKWLNDFNHVYSNLGFIYLGILALWNIRCCEWRRHQRKDFIIPPNFGVLRALAWTMIVEGLMRGSYHVCPNSFNFYHNVDFVALASLLVMVRSYQARHKLTNAACYVAVYTLVGEMLLEVANDPTLRFLQTTLYMFMSLQVAENFSILASFCVFSVGIISLVITETFLKPILRDGLYTDVGGSFSFAACTLMDFYGVEDVAQFVSAFIFFNGIMVFLYQDSKPVRPGGTEEKED